MVSHAQEPGGLRGIHDYIGSLLRLLPDLYALCGLLDAAERAPVAGDREITRRLAHMRNTLFVSLMPVVQTMMSLRAMRRVMHHHCSTFSLSAPEYTPLSMLEQSIEAPMEGIPLRAAIEAAAGCRPDDYRPVYALALLDEDAGDHESAMKRYRDLFDHVRHGAFALYRGAGLLPGSAETVEARYRMAVERHPSFNPARRACAGLIRERDPLEAAAQYSSMLTNSPALNYDSQSWAAAQKGWIEVEAYRDFRVFFRQNDGQYLAFPVLFGLPFSPSAPSTLRMVRRFVGLLALRLYKDKFWRHLAMRSTGAIPVRDRTGPANSLADRIVEAAMRAADRALSAARRWARHRLHRFQFALQAANPLQIRVQIDRTHDMWLGDHLLGKVRD